MKLVIILAVLAFVAARPDEKYERLNNLDIKELLDNERLLAALGKCLAGSGKCTPEGDAIKETIPEALQNSCEKCDEEQKKNAAQITGAIKEKLPEIWEELMKIYNPGNKYTDTIENFLAKYGH